MTQPPPNPVHAETRAAWQARLDAHHTQTEGVWAISFKKGTGKPRPSYDEIG